MVVGLLVQAQHVGVSAARPLEIRNLVPVFAQGVNGFLVRFALQAVVAVANDPTVSSDQVQREQRRQAPVWRRAKWWLLGAPIAD